MSHKFLATLFSLGFFLALPVFASPVAAAEDSLSSRVANLEAGWGHLSLGGEFILQGEIYHGKPFSSELENGNRLIPGGRQELKLKLGAQVSPQLSGQIILANQGFWGVSQPSDGNIDKPPLIAPFLIDEAVARYQRPNFLGDFGRFYFTLDPMGLIADHSSYPIEGIALQTSLGHVYLGGYYSRLSSFYQPGNLHITATDDELALRIALPRPKYLLGLTWVPTSLAKDTALAVDFSGWLGKMGLQTSLAWYKPSPDNYVEYTHDGAWGFLANLGILAEETRSLNMKIGYFQAGFTPTFSRLAHAVVGDGGEPFSPNTKGLAFTYQQALTAKWSIIGEISFLSPVDESIMTEAGKQTMADWRITAVRHISPNAYLELGYDSDDTALGRYGRIFTGLNMRF
ncbi:MAG TPA: hypothetical protein GX391_03385 [Firmicutes bacterium]|jgi:hypothetical protein|nr:hypothetical protein [Bacillota bacterium]HOQ24125.1 hypothetical protein [Bacillota bacterium]HPT66430.1 hypothetical protein [Bacillota bacterium]